MWRTIKRAFWDTISFFGWNKKSLIFLLLYLAGLFIFWYREGIEAMMEELGAFFAFGLILVGAFTLLLFLVKLIQAPVYIEFEEKMKPRLKIERVTEQLYGGLGSVRGLTIHNQSSDEAINCQGRLVEMEFAIPQEGLSLFRFPTNQPLKWGEEPRGISSGNISIPGSESAVLNIIRWESRRDNPRLAYASIDSHLIDTLPTGYEILLVISITSQNSTPIYAICLLDLMSKPEGYDLVFLGNRDQQPSIDDCRQLVSDRHNSQIE